MRESSSQRVDVVSRRTRHVHSSRLNLTPDSDQSHQATNLQMIEENDLDDLQTNIGKQQDKHSARQGYQDKFNRQSCKGHPPHARAHIPSNARCTHACTKPASALSSRQVRSALSAVSTFQLTGRHGSGYGAKQAQS